MFKEYEILVVDDDLVMQEYLGYLLEKKCKALYFANNGKEGLLQYQKYHPDLVITDLNMPLMNGIRMSTFIKEVDFLQPIILLTAFGEIKDLQDAINIGLNAFLSKPIQNRELLYDTMKKLLQNRDKHIPEDILKANSVVKNLLHDNQEYINYEELYEYDEQNI